ncbi:COG4315 family predicted lipoprotein [Amycolatopsis anabasis]|uniref:COG4315 family predicted lipoprotein n=1 Tax=Amycolatopsis anabasis TaxID=1840409 RepID=UPI00131B38A5|nr:hypothetical protein [Amycolatopsis anabasis]
MAHRTVVSTVIFGSLFLAACGSGGDPASPDAAPGGWAIRDVPGAGSVLAGVDGRTVYTSEQESGGKVACTNSCLDIWRPVIAETPPAAPAGLPGKLGVLTRPDGGGSQVTYDEMPLYTFKFDEAPGEAKGDNLADEFAEGFFTWHAVTAQGQPGGAPAKPTADGGYGY